MDPLTAFANLTEAIVKFLTVIAEGQTPEQKKQLWDWYIEDMKFLRGVFNIKDVK